MDSDCNKFIISNEEFTRDFEKMYKNVPDPWGQEEKHEECMMNTSAFWFLSRIIDQNQKIKTIADIGCAKGYYSKELLSLTERGTGDYFGTDISQTAIMEAEKRLVDNHDQIQFIVDDIRVINEHFINKFDLIFSAKTLYYVAPEIDQVLLNIFSYLAPNGLLCFTYNSRTDSFSNKWLTYSLLREKILKLGLNERLFVEINRYGEEKLAIGIFQK